MVFGFVIMCYIGCGGFYFCYITLFKFLYRRYFAIKPIYKLFILNYSY